MFDDKIQKCSILDEVYSIIQERKKSMPKGSYVASLFKGGHDRILKKIGEEAGEVIIASKNNEPKEIVYEIADLWFHTLVVLGYHDISPEEIYEELIKRFKK
ncbi:MAG: phosphoribosyl-ATP diphosphatase [Spirochaetota bacterium]|nr:phosphoribosyl-ATP diphosphatase [Spirochaetota bacterium]